MDGRESTNTEARLLRLEEENRRLARDARRLRRAGLAFALGIGLPCASLILMGASYQPGPPDLVGRSLVIKDGNGVDRIFAGFNNEGAGQILFRDEQGKVHVQLVSTANGEISALNLFDIDGQLKANLFVNRTGQGMTANGQRIP
ncbi:hypothetical protein OJF2_71070 [Aquisphaera giovannonii]|uniref:Uncharacterized protein n=1 Tax=Aquisphaera giovannonii TaxID=406548 RepID=A0A5B9WE71_9BACT|nr:hypothetical protein [Aquisphaera giovannonii]QEH38504.1 hypothetical protein OJF2_71070 [Aquisphaera giovannonii]